MKKKRTAILLLALGFFGLAGAVRLPAPAGACPEGTCAPVEIAAQPEPPAGWATGADRQP
ncbi:MAG: hypothetical protein AAGK14_00580 [Verrucomicrobiota bacterium]